MLFALLAVLVLGLIVQARVQSTYKKFSKTRASSGIPANEMARQLLQNANSGVSITQVKGYLTDHFNPKTHTVGLSDAVYHSDSIAALAVAAHEIGHVMQYEDDYLPIRIRNAILPVAQIGSSASPFIVILGLMFGSYEVAIAGVILFAAVLLFQLVTLPVEFNASSRAVSMLVGSGFITYDEESSAKKVLRAAAMTYVVAVLSSLVTLPRLLFIARGSRRD